MGLSWKHRVIQNFDRCAHSYEQYGGVQDIVASHLAADLSFVEGGSILEIGCGTGLLTKHLAGQRHLGLNLHVTDISSRMVQQAKANLGNHRIHWSILDAEKQQSGQKYDLIIASMACQWFEDFQRGMKNVVEMLNPGGTFYFSLPGPDSFKEWRDTLKTIGLSSGMLDFHVPKGLYKEEMIIRPCQDSLDFLRSLKNLGAASARKNHQPLTIPQMKAACAAFDAQNFKQITWHILYGRITKNQETRGMHV